MTSVEQARRDVQHCVKEALAIVEGEDNSSVRALEEQLWVVLLGLGRALMTLFFAHRLADWPVSRGYEHAGVQYHVERHQRAELGTRFGKMEFMRPVGRATGYACLPQDLPMDRQLEVSGGFVLSVVTTIAKLAAHMAFAPSRALFRGIFGWAPSPRAVLRMVDAVGKQARPFLDGEVAPDQDGEVLVITVDGKGAPAISSKEYSCRTRPHGSRPKNRRHQRRQQRQGRPRVRRSPGKKSKNAKVAAVGVLYTLRRDEAGKLEGPCNKRVYATFESNRALFQWIHGEAVKRGYGTAKYQKVLFIADGADVLWKLQEEYFPDADVCLDWFHVVEKLWAAGKAVCRHTRKRRRHLEQWVAVQKSRLRRGKLDEIIAELELALESTATTGPGNKFRRKVLDSTLQHFIKNQSRMQYRRLRRQDLDISSGVAEGAVRHVVGMRLDGPGMRWGRDRAEAVLHLRCILVSGLWKRFERYLSEQPPLRLPAQPMPTRTHDAVMKDAA